MVNSLRSFTDLLQLLGFGGDVPLGEAGVQLAEQPAEGSLLDDRGRRHRPFRRTDDAVTAGRLDTGGAGDPFEVLTLFELCHLPDRDRELRLADPGFGADANAAFVEPLDRVDGRCPLGPPLDVAEHLPHPIGCGLDRDGVIEAHVPNGTSHRRSGTGSIRTGSIRDRAVWRSRPSLRVWSGAMADQNVPQTQNVDNELDPGANTQMFRAFVNEGQTETAAEPKVNGRILAVIGALVVLIAVIAAILVF